MDKDSYKGWKNTISSIIDKHNTAFYHAKVMVYESMEYKTCQVSKKDFVYLFYNFHQGGYILRCMKFSL